MKAVFNNNFTNQTNDVMVNPENPVNPDSNQFTWKLPNHIEAFSTIFVTLHHRIIPHATSYINCIFQRIKKIPDTFVSGILFFIQLPF